MFHLQIAIALARLLGTLLAFSTVLLAMMAMFIPGATVGQLRYGKLIVEEPTYWQILLLSGSILATAIPPWWMLQLALAKQRSEGV